MQYEPEDAAAISQKPGRFSRIANWKRCSVNTASLPFAYEKSVERTEQRGCYARVPRSSRGSDKEAFPAPV
jgi:hypothetical protein